MITKYLEKGNQTNLIKRIQKDLESNEIDFF